MYSVSNDYNPIEQAHREQVKSEKKPVQTYQLSEDELRAYRIKLVHVKSGLTREEVIRRVADGETLLQIEKKSGMKVNEIYAWAKKWEITGLTQKKAQEMLSKRVTVEEVEEMRKQDKPQPAEPVTVQSNVQETVHEQETVQSTVQSEKVGISQSLADAIESARTEYTDSDILRGVATGLFDPSNGGDKKWDPLYDCDLLLLASALISGYRIVKTPEEIIQEVYNTPHWPVYELSNDKAYRLGIKHALQTMGHQFKWLS